MKSATGQRGKAASLVVVAVLICSFMILPVPGLAAQGDDDPDRYRFDFSGQPLSEALETIASGTSVNLVYDPSIVRDQYVYRRLRGNSVNEILTALLRNTGLDFIILSSGTYVVVEAAHTQPATGSLTGSVVDAFTGEPLQGATVMLADASAGVVTNRSGQFNLSGMISGEQKLIFSYVGYEPVSKVIEIPPNGNLREQIHLYPRPSDFAPVVVSAHRPAMNTRSHTESAAARTDWELAGRQQGAIQSLSLFSGVQHGLPLSDTHIQGGQRSDHRLHLDGVPVYNPYSFGQLFSAFSPYAISRVEVDKAGFDASAGSHISGRINLSHTAPPRSGQRAIAQADPLSTNLFGAASVGERGNRAGVMAAFRSSVWGVFQDPVLSSTLGEWETVDPLLYDLITNTSADKTMTYFAPVNNASEIGFSDLHLAGLWEAGPYSRIGFSLYSGNNEVTTDVLARDRMLDAQPYMFSRDSYRWENTVAQLSWDWVATPRLDLGFQAAYSTNRMRHGYHMADDDLISELQKEADAGEEDLFRLISDNIRHGGAQLDGNHLRHYTFRADATYAVNPGFSVQAGLQGDRLESGFDLSGLFYLPALANQQSNLYSGYTHLRFMLPGSVQLMTGSRFTYVSGSGKLYAEPRARLQYDRTDSAIGFWSVRLAGGIYRQFVNQFDLTNAGPSSIVPSFTIWAHDAGLAQPMAYHTSLSFISEPTSTTSVRAESWMRLQPTGYITSYERLLLTGTETPEGFSSFAELTSMRSWGAGLRVTQSAAGERVRFMAGYDYSYSTVDMQNQFGRWAPAPWNQPHTLQAGVTTRVTEAFTVAARWQRISGRTWAWRQAYYDFLMMHNVHSAGQFDFTSPWNDRLPAFDQIDLSLIYRQAAGFSNIEARIDLMNVLNTRNIIDRGVFPSAVHADGTQELSVRDRRLPGFNPSVSLQISF
jgi:hypothetical protein